MPIQFVSDQPRRNMSRETKKVIIPVGWSDEYYQRRSGWRGFHCLCSQRVA